LHDASAAQRLGGSHIRMRQQVGLAHVEHIRGLDGDHLRGAVAAPHHRGDDLDPLLPFADDATGLARVRDNGPDPQMGLCSHVRPWSPVQPRNEWKSFRWCVSLVDALPDLGAPSGVQWMDPHWNSLNRPWPLGGVRSSLVG
jgi:hypothetical protein